MKKATSLLALLASFNLDMALPAIAAGAAHRAVLALNDYGK